MSTSTSYYLGHIRVLQNQVYAVCVREKAVVSQPPDQAAIVVAWLAVGSLLPSKAMILRRQENRNRRNHPRYEASKTRKAE
ncbi:hypothetical protein AC579_7562 [Pseudocercospora musae]|uniref:Uncharacterized protein n=1 Tax=Pseudocercospora musae TaxID=113226 RepID=A0A139IHR6_9PEZI|nr:hypothetical protein AC579_7562 [Pseudocercospora musae]